MTMKYYLGKATNGSYEKIDLSKVVADSEDINSVYNYVFSFNNYQELVDDLFNRGLIDKKNVHLAYCSVFQGKLKPLFNGTTMYFRDAKDFFSVNNIRLFLYDNQYNLDLVNYLFLCEIRKYRVIDNLRKSFEKNLSSKEAFLAHLDYLSKRRFSEEFLRRWKDMGNYVSTHEIRYLRKDGLLMGMINATMKDIVDSDHDLMVLYNSESHGKTPTSLDLLFRLQCMVRQENSVGQYNFEMTSDEDNNVKGVIDSFLREELTNKTKDGRKSSPRKLIDLAMLLYNYCHKNDKQVEIEEDEEYEDETYLDEDDFLRIGISPEEMEDYGYYKTNPNNSDSLYRRK